MFDGLRFSEDKYTHREAKRLIRLLRAELQQRKDLRELGVDPRDEGRPALRGQDLDPVWDILRLKKKECSTAPFTAFPHLTMGLDTNGAKAAVTIPNGMKGGLWLKLKQGGIESFGSLVGQLNQALRYSKSVQSEEAKPSMYVHQRHFVNRSRGITDGKLEVDLRTLAGCREAGVRRQPGWIDAIYNLLTHKRSNIQFGVEVRFKYDCPIVGSPKVVDLFADTWIALKPLLEFALPGK